MGLHVSSVVQIANAAPELRNIEYFVYILDYYNFSEGVMEAVTAELPKLEAHFARLGNAVLVASVGNLHFANEVLSWHDVVGRNPKEICPALFICNLPPSYFSEGRSNDAEMVSYTDEELNKTVSLKSPWIILELGKLCDNKDDVLAILKSVVSDIADGKALSDFEFTGSHAYESRPIVSGKLRYAGVEFDLRAAIAKSLKWFSNKKLW